MRSASHSRLETSSRLKALGGLLTRTRLGIDSLHPHTLGQVRPESACPSEAVRPTSSSEPGTDDGAVDLTAPNPSRRVRVRSNLGTVGDKQVGKQNGIVEWTRERLQVAGFEGFQRLAGLSPARVPQVEGVYIILRPSREQPEFLSNSVAGHFKGRDPSASTDQLRRAWVDGA